MFLFYIWTLDKSTFTRSCRNKFILYLNLGQMDFVDRRQQMNLEFQENFKVTKTPPNAYPNWDLQPYPLQLPNTTTVPKTLQSGRFVFSGRQFGAVSCHHFYVRKSYATVLSLHRVQVSSFSFRATFILVFVFSKSSSQILSSSKKWRSNALLMLI